MAQSGHGQRLCVYPTGNGKKIALRMLIAKYSTNTPRRRVTKCVHNVLLDEFIDVGGLSCYGGGINRPGAQLGPTQARSA